MHIKSRAEFIFQRSFDDGLLVYCFIDGLKVEIREALELSAPQTLERAFDLAKFQESALEGMFLGFNEFELQVHTITGVNELSRGVHRVKDVDAPSSLTVMQLITQPGAATIVIALDKKEEVNASILQGAITRSAGIWEGVLELGRVAGIKVKSVDTTGAGDSRVARLLYCLASNMNLYPDETKLKDTLLFANALAWYWTVTILVFDPGDINRHQGVR